MLSQTTHLFSDAILRKRGARELLSELLRLLEATYRQRNET